MVKLFVIIAALVWASLQMPGHYTRSDKRGTVLVVVYDNRGVVLASDSRTTKNEGPEFRDDQCKILRLGETVLFAAAGSVEFNHVRFGNNFFWNAHIQAEDIFQKSTDIRWEKSGESLARDWAQATVDKFARASENGFEYALRGRGKDAVIVGAIFISRKADGTLVVAMVRVVRDMLKRVPTFHGQTGFLDTMSSIVKCAGSDESESLHAICNPATVEEQKLRVRFERESGIKLGRRASKVVAARKIAQFVIRNGNNRMTGGPVAIAEIGESGNSRWVEKPPHCAAASQGTPR